MYQTTLNLMSCPEPVWHKIKNLTLKDDNTLSQQIMSADPTEDMHIATKKYIDVNLRVLASATMDYVNEAINSIPSESNVSLNVTGATVGQTVKISAVDANGVPTAWVPVDMTAGKELSWIEVVDITTSEQTQILTISTDKDGHMISQYNALGMIAAILFPADASQTSNNGAPWIYPMPLSIGVSDYRRIANISGWKTIDRTLTMAWAGLPRVGWIDQTNAQMTFSANAPDFLKGLTIYIHDSGDHIPTGTRVRVAVLSRGIEE